MYFFILLKITEKNVIKVIYQKPNLYLTYPEIIIPRSVFSRLLS